MRLIVEQGKLAGHGFELERPVIVVGRGKDCDIILDEHQVSRQHARLQQTPQGWTLTDLGSTNGTQVNGRPLKAHEPYALQPGDRVALGTSVLALSQPAAAAGAPQPHASRRAGKPRPALLIVGAVLIAVVLVGTAVALVLLLQDKEQETAPGGTGPLDQIDQVLEIPTLLEGLPTALPIPTQLEELATAMPIPTSIEELATSLPVPTELQELVTAIPIGTLGLPMQVEATPPPLSASLPGSQGAAQ